MKVKVSAEPGVQLPAYATESSAGMDVRAFIPEEIVLQPGERTLIPTGLRVEIPHGYEIQMRPRSGLALKKGISLLNSPGTIDADYRGEIGVILINHSSEAFAVCPGERICQMVLARVPQIEWVETSSLENSERGEGGFGHTGTK
ncbi:MAG: dUTP diphosphatase [Muribaculaceae bacterium]|nr:dUTP diphosphatase [Muribaculaceae bacterium]